MGDSSREDIYLGEADSLCPRAITGEGINFGPLPSGIQQCKKNIKSTYPQDAYLLVDKWEKLSK